MRVAETVGGFAQAGNPQISANFSLQNAWPTPAGA
jgi:hypothetical protein